MEDLDLDNMTDEQMEQILADIQHGKYNDTEQEENQEDDVDENSDKDNDEDTEDQDSDESGTETNEIGDGEDQDTEDDAEDEDSENTPVDQADEGNDDNDNEADDLGGDQDTETETIDAAEYERYKKFYETIANAEFNANGKKVKGFTDPDKIIQAQQMAYGFSDKMASFKQYRPYMSSLKERGMLEDPAKFNFVMDLLDGDPEALKKHLQSLKVDPLDLDMENVSYTGQKNHLTSKEELVVEDALEQAKNYGVEDKLRTTLAKEWDAESFNEFLTVPEVRRDLLEHMATGAYDLVQDRIAEMKTLDITGTFTSLKATDQYRQAVQSLTADAQRMNNSVQNRATQEASVKPAATRPTNNKDAELAKAKAKQEAEYKRNLEEKNRLAEEARKRATSVSKKKVSTTEQKKFDPLALEGKELDDFVMSLIRS